MLGVNLTRGQQKEGKVKIDHFFLLFWHHVTVSWKQPNDFENFNSQGFLNPSLLIDKLIKFHQYLIIILIKSNRFSFTMLLFIGLGKVYNYFGGGGRVPLSSRKNSSPKTCPQNCFFFLKLIYKFGLKLNLTISSATRGPRVVANSILMKYFFKL